MNDFMNDDTSIIMDGTTATATDTSTMMMMPLSQSSSQSRSLLPCARGMDDMYLDTLHKLHESMKRSKETRQSLSIQTQHTQEYERTMCVTQIIQSVQNSSQQVDKCLRGVVLLHHNNNNNNHQ